MLSRTFACRFQLGAMVFGRSGQRMVLTCGFKVEMSRMMYDTLILCYQLKVVPASNY